MSNDVPIPLVDFSCLESSESDEDLQMIGNQIVDGFQQRGFVYLKNHGIPEEDVKSFIRETCQFFDLEEDYKKKFKREPVRNHGYLTEQHEIVKTTISMKNRASRNIFDIQGLDELFPDEEVPEMRTATKIVLDKLIPITKQVLRSIELGLGMKKGTLIDNHKLLMERDNVTDFRSIRYLPPKNNEEITRLEAHYDISTITLQLYGDLEGLEVLSEDGVWNKAKLYPGHILLFPSDIIQRWTGDKLKALKHRVVIPDDEDTRIKPRHAVILFVHPDNETIIEPFDGSKKYEPIKAIDFAKKRAAAIYS